MDQPYSMWADWLSKFHTWPEGIQALWLVSAPLTLLGLTWLVMRGLSAALLTRRRERGMLVYGVYRDRKGRWMVYRHGRQPREVDWTDPPPELVGRGQVIQGVFRRPEEWGNADAPSTVIPGLVPGIHVFCASEDVDGRNKSGHDGEEAARFHSVDTWNTSSMTR